jgi:hypothetical protein
MKLLASFLALVVLAVVSPAYGTINVDIYTGFTDPGIIADPVTGGGAPYSGLFGSLTSDTVLFGSDNLDASNNFNWHPFDLESFGADIRGYIKAESDTTDIKFGLKSDDGSLLFIDGVLEINNGGDHGPQLVEKLIDLSAGLHTFEIQFYEAHGGPSGVDLYFQAEGVHYADAVPEPTAIIVWSMLGVTGIFYGWRKRKAL